MFLGQYEHSIDEKGRLTVPARYRELLNGGAVVTQGLDENLYVFTTDAFNQLYASVNASSMGDAKSRLLRRLLFSQAADVEVDKAGRMLVPQYLRQKNNIDGNVMLIGTGPYFEIWSKAAWAEQESKMNEIKTDEDSFAAFNLVIQGQ